MRAQRLGRVSQPVPYWDRPARRLPRTAQIALRTLDDVVNLIAATATLPFLHETGAHFRIGLADGQPHEEIESTAHVGQDGSGETVRNCCGDRAPGRRRGTRGRNPGGWPKAGKIGQVGQGQAGQDGEVPDRDQAPRGQAGSAEGPHRAPRDRVRARRPGRNRRLWHHLRRCADRSRSRLPAHVRLCDGAHCASAPGSGRRRQQRRGYGDRRQWRLRRTWRWLLRGFLRRWRFERRQRDGNVDHLDQRQPGSGPGYRHRYRQFEQRRLDLDFDRRPDDLDLELDGRIHLHHDRRLDVDLDRRVH